MTMMKLLLAVVAIGVVIGHPAVAPVAGLGDRCGNGPLQHSCDTGLDCVDGLCHRSVPIPLPRPHVSTTPPPPPGIAPASFSSAQPPSPIGGLGQVGSSCAERGPGPHCRDGLLCRNGFCRASSPFVIPRVPPSVRPLQVFHPSLFRVF